MNIDPNEIAKIQRPKLLMSAAKELVVRRKFLGRQDHSIAQNLQSLLEKEAHFEFQRQNAPAEYRAEKHIEALAHIIEYVRHATTPLSVVH